MRNRVIHRDDSVIRIDRRCGEAPHVIDSELSLHATRGCFASRAFDRRVGGIGPFDAKAEHCQTNHLRSYPASAIKDPLAVGRNWQEAGKHIPLAQNGSVPIIEDEVIALGQFIVKTIVHTRHPDGEDYGTCQDMSLGADEYQFA